MLKTGIKFLIAALIIIVFVWTFVFLYQKSRQKPVTYATENAFRTDIVKKAVATGSITPRKEVEIKPQVSGIIDRLYVEAGVMVKKNDLIAKIRLTPNMITLNAAESRLDKAVIAHQDAEATFKREKALYEAAAKCMDGPIGAEVFTLSGLKSAQTAFQRAELNLKDARKTHDREKELYQKSLANDQAIQQTEHQYLTAATQYDDAKMQLAMAEAQAEEICKARFQNAETAYAMAKAELVAAERNLDLISTGSTEGKTEWANTFVRSTIDGMVLSLPVKEGSSVVEVSTTSIGSTIAVVADMNDMIFEGNIDESEIGNTKKGMDLILSIAAIEEEKFTAAIEYISPKGIKDKGAVQFTIRAAVQLKEQYFIRSGYSANADVVLDKRSNVLAVNERLLQFGDTGVFVEVETTPQQFIQKPIKVGLSDGLKIEVLEGLGDMDRIKVPK